MRVALLANNHVGDLGADGLRSTHRLLKQQGVQPVGIATATPLADLGPAFVLLEVKRVRVAIFAFCLLRECTKFTQR